MKKEIFICTCCYGKIKENILISGITRRIAFPIIFSYILLSFITMEIYIKFRSKGQSQSDSINENKSKFISWTIISGFAFQFIMDKVYPDSMKGENFFPFKIFFNNFLFFIMIPTIMIINFENLQEHCRQYMKTKLSSVQMLFQFQGAFNVTDNKVSPEIIISKI